MEGRWRVRDLWEQKDLGVFSSAYSADVPVHATHLVLLFPEAGAGLRKGLTFFPISGRALIQMRKP